MRTYHLDCGNSTLGPVGLCARVVANSKRDAVRKLRRAIERAVGPAGEITVQSDEPAVGYINVYLSPENISASDLDVEDQEPVPNGQ